MALYLTIVLTSLATCGIGLVVGYAVGRAERRTDDEWRMIMSYEHLQAGEDPKQ